MTVTQCSAGSLSQGITTSTNQFTGFAYDSSGNETGGIGTQGYDAENRMTTAGYTGFTLTNAFDALNLKITKTRSDGLYPKMYWRDIWGNTLSESDSSGHMLNDYIYFAGKRIAYVTSSGSQYYYLTDHLGSVRKITDATGNKCFDADYTPYGDAVILMTGCPAQPYLFAGMERDDNVFDYDFARYYSSRLGRFMSADPLGGDATDPQSLNRYAYVVNNPINNIDPTGMLCKPDQSCWGDGWNDPSGSGGGSWGGGGGGGGWIGDDPEGLWDMAAMGMAFGWGPGFNLDEGFDPNFEFGGTGYNQSSTFFNGSTPVTQSGSTFYANLMGITTTIFSLPGQILSASQLSSSQQGYGGLSTQQHTSEIGTPLTSSECSKYLQGGSASGRGLYNICRLAPDDPWSQRMRGCLQALYNPTSGYLSIPVVVPLLGGTIDLNAIVPGTGAHLTCATNASETN